MFRRSRFSIRPNVVTAGRTAAAPQEAPSANQEANETPKDVSESSSTTTAVTDNKSVVTPSEKPAAPGDGNDQNGEGTSSSAAVQRRKRFSIKPKVAPGRPSTLARMPKSPLKAVSETPIEIPVSDLDKPTKSTLSGTIASPQRLQSPRRRRPSEDSKQPKTQPKSIIIPSDSSEPSAVPTAKDFLEQIHLPTDSGKELESTSGSQVEEVPSRLPDKVPPSLPDKEAIEISEKAKNLVSSKTGLSLSQPAFSLSRLLNDPSDLQRIAKAQKLRELLKQEMHKEKRIKRAKARVKEYTLDPAKMTMRDLIRYLPLSNPMTSSLEDATRENETVVPPSPVREDSPERAQEPVVLPKIASPREEAAAEAEAEEDADADAEEEQDDAVMVPQVKVAEDGSLIIDEESLTVEVQRAKGPNPAQDRDPIFERGSTTTYSSFRKGTYSKPWSSEETDMFFLAISMVGTDFSMICQLFPHRARSEIKNKFKKEERENAWRIDKAFRERRKLDIEYFSKLLEKILEVQKTRKKLKSLAEKKSPKKKENKKTKGKKASRKLSVVEEGDEEEQNEIPDLEEEGEKENDDLCNEGGTTVAKPQKKRKRKNKPDASTKEPNDKKNKTGENEQDEAYIPGDTEAALPEDCPKSDMSEKTDNVNESKDHIIKPAKLSRGRAPKPLLPLGRKWGKKKTPPSTKTNDTASDKEDESEIDGASKDQVNKDPSPLKQATKRKSANDDISSGEEDVTVQPPRPTRYGRVPKPTKPLNYPGKEATHSSETTPASPAGSTASAAMPKPKCTAKRGRSSKLQPAQESKKPKLVTLRASQSEYSDEEDEKQQEEEEVEEEHPACSSSNDSTAPVFVPASLRSPHPVISEVEETMEELDILANMPDVLGISQDVLCRDAFCERAQNEIGTAEPCEHQLDLLVDVIDFLSVENTEVSEDESYNEAAQTLLTIGNLAHLSQSAQNQIATQDDIKGTTPVSVNETSQHLEEEIAYCSKPAAQEENSATLMSATSVHGGPGNVTTVELQNRTTDTDAIPVIQSSDQRTGSDMDPTPQLHLSQESSKTNSPQTRRGCLTKVKPKPNLGQSSRTAQSKSQPETSTERTPEESHTVAPDLFQTTETLSAAEEIPTIADCSKTNVNVEISHFEVKHTSASTDEVIIYHVGTTESSCNNQVTSDSALTESQIGQWSNIDSAPVKESSDHSAPVEVLPVSQKEESEVPSTSQTRKSRFQKVKPKLNLAQTSRTVRSKLQTTKDTVKKDSNPTPNLKFTEKTGADVEAEPTCIISSEKQSPSHCPASAFIPSLVLGTSFTPTEELSTTEEKKTDVGVVGQVESGAATSYQSALENQNLSEAQFVPRREQATRDTTLTSESTDEVLMSHVGTTETSCNNPSPPESAVTESQIGPESNIDFAPVQESSKYPASCVLPVEVLPVSQKEESEVASTRQTRKSRFQKVRPNLNLSQTSRTVRCKPQTTKENVEKDSNPSPNPKFYEKAIAEVEAEPTCITSAEKPRLSPGPTSDFIPSMHLGSTLTPTEERSTTEEKKTDIGVVCQVESNTATSDQSASENQNLSETQLEPRREQATRDTMLKSESIDEVLMCHVGTTESSCNNPLTSDSAVTESQIGQESNIDSVPVQESSNYPASCVTRVEELPVSQKEDREVASTSQTKKSRFQKVKPNLNLAQTSRAVRSKLQTTKGIGEKDSNATLKKIAKYEGEPTCITSPEKPSQSPCTASDLIPSLDLETTFTPTEELSTTDAKKRDVGVVGQLESGATKSHQSPSESQNLSKAHFEPSKEQATRDSTQTLESKDEKPMSHVGTTESSCNNPLTSDSALTESQVGHGSNIDSVQESSDHPAPCVTPVEELPASQKEKSKVVSTCQTTRGLLQKVKPILPQTSRTVRSKAQTTKDPFTPLQLPEIRSSPTLTSESTDKTKAEVEAQPTCSTTPPEKPSQLKSTGSLLVSVPSLELCSTHKSTEELCSTEEQKIDVRCRLDSKSEGSEQNVPQRRRHFPKVKHKPNLGSAPRTTFTKLPLKDVSKPSEQCHMDTSLTFEQRPEDNNNAQTELELAETDSRTSTHCSLHTEPLSSTMLEGPAESEKSLDNTNYKGTSSDNVVIATSWVAENQSVLTNSVLTQSSEKATVEGETTGGKTSNNDVVAGPASQWDRKQGMSIRDTNTQPTDDPTAVSDVHTSEDGSTESKIEFKPPTNTQSTSDPKISTQQPLSENDSEAQSQDAVQLCSETTDTNQTAAQRTDDNQSTPTDSPSRKAPQTCRGQLIKPKPNLGRSSRPAQPQQIQKTKQAEADFGTCSEGVDSSVCHKLVSERRPDIQEPVEGAIEQCSNQNPSPSDAGSSLGCLTQVIEQLSQDDPPPNVAGSSLGCVENVTQDASTSSTGGTKSHPSLNTILPDMLLQQEPLDADEPFFILSLTEIPVCSLGEVVDSVPEPLPYLPVTEASIEQQSVPGESLAAAGDGLLSNVAVPVFMEESGETGLINAIDIGPDPAADIGSIMENPVDPHEKNDETEIPPAKQRLMDTHRRAKLQIKPNTTKRKQVCKTLAAKEAESIPIQTNPTQHSELPGPSVQPKVFDDDVMKGSDDHVDVKKETLTGGEDPEDSSSGAQTTRTRRASSRNRKAKGSLSLTSETNNAAPASDSPPGKEAPKGRKVKTPGAAGKPSTPAPGASTSYDVAPTPSQTQLTQETRSTSSTTSPTQTEVDAEQTSEHSPLCSDTSPSTSLCPAEVSASQQSVESSSIEEEPTSVSQYFLSDIFTDVTTEKNDETEIPPAAQTLMETQRRAKLQVKPNTTKRKQACKTLAAKEAESMPIQTNTTQHSELPGPSVQPNVFDDDVTEPQKGSDGHVDFKKETLTGGEDPEDSSLGTQTTRTRRASSRNRKAKGSLSLTSEMNNAAPASDSPPGKEAPKGRKVKTPGAAGKPSTPAPGVSTSYDVAPTPSQTQPTQETRSTSSTTSPTQTEVDAEQTSEHSPLCSDTSPSTSLCPAEVSASQQSVESSSIEEEPTSVSQYFLSDIFTDVTTEKNDETEIPPAAQTGMDTHRREPDKLQVKPNTTKRKQACKTLAAKEAESIPIQTNTTQHSELPGPSEQPNIFDDDVTEPQKGSDGHVDVKKETLTGGEDPEDSSLGTQTTRTRWASSRNRKAKGSLSLTSEMNNAAPASDSPPGKEAPKGRKVKTPGAAGKPSTPAPGASTSYDVAPTPSQTQLTQETRSTSSTTSPTQTEVDAEQTSEHSPLCSDTSPSTSLCPAEVSASQQSVESSSIEEEPTSVSQYFLSDIFTEVTTEKNDETEIPPAAQTGMDTHRRAKLQVKPNTTKRKQACKTLAAKEAESMPIQTNTTRHSELPGPSVQPKVFDDDVTEPQKGSDGHVDFKKETLTGGEDPEDSSLGTQTTRTRRASSRNRKAKGSLSLTSETNNAAPASDSPPGKEAPKGRKVKTPGAAGKPSTPAPGVSTSYDVAPTPSQTQLTQETRSTSSTTSPTQTEVDAEQTSEHSPLCSDTSPSTSLCPAEVRKVSASQQSVESSSIEEEPTSVSQYFLSDIFTDVEEG
ncbi:mucin-5AC isoform X3 [Perca fluviatilis]|uniref:mucin-5AC isoform X3 n=1 Tax=Perca fluviatilis TaxID=8168 RepID=UPI001964E2F1|nr:mucin-5AC isoform X3 [Perca fluviatilis]